MKQNITDGEREAREAVVEKKDLAGFVCSIFFRSREGRSGPGLVGGRYGAGQGHGGSIVARGCKADWLTRLVSDISYV